MQTFQDGEEARRHVWSLRENRRTVGLVPTMGALHAGHLSLVRQSVREFDHTVVSIFVNPTQFAPHEDLNKYPRTFDADCRLVERAGAAMVFAPSVEEMYPRGFSTFIDPPDVASPLEGVHRRDHFRGVATVVLKLFGFLPATHAIFGSKDYQQLKVIQAITRDLSIGVKIIAGKTVREPDGLALSSRNRYLSSDERARALSLSRALAIAKQMADQGERDVPSIESAMQVALAEVTSIDYAVVADAETLQPLARLDRPAQALIAAHVGTTRLIDNRRLN